MTTDNRTSKSILEEIKQIDQQIVEGVSNLSSLVNIKALLSLEYEQKLLEEENEE